MRLAIRSSSQPSWKGRSSWRAACSHCSLDSKTPRVQLPLTSMRSRSQVSRPIRWHTASTSGWTIAKCRRSCGTRMRVLIAAMLVGLGPCRFLRGRFAAHHARPGDPARLEPEESDRGLRLGLHLGLALGPPAPARHHETPGILEQRAHLLVARGMEGVLVAGGAGLLQERGLDVSKEPVALVGAVVQPPSLLLAYVAAHHHRLPA